jgi:hypothetical protein
MRLQRTAYAAVVPFLLTALVGCGSDTAETAADDSSPTPSASTSADPTTDPSADVSEEPSAEPSFDPDPAVVAGIDGTFDADALTVTVEVPELVASDRVLLMYRQQRRDVRVAVESILIGDEPRLNGVWTDYSTEMSGRLKDVEATWDLAAGTITFTLRDHLNGTQATVAAIGLGPKDRYPVEPPADAVSTTIQRS